MELIGGQNYPASRETFWAVLNDLRILRQCILGCGALTQCNLSEIAGAIKLKVGLVSAPFSGGGKLSCLTAPESYRTSGQGQGELASLASGGADVKLTPLGAQETQLDYAVDAQIGGKLAMLGSRVIESTAQSLAKQFFGKFGVIMKAQADKALTASRAEPAKKIAEVKKSKKKQCA